MYTLSHSNISKGYNTNRGTPPNLHPQPPLYTYTHTLRP